MRHDPIQVPGSARRGPPARAGKPRLVVAGATGVLGTEVLRQLAGGTDFGDVVVLAREPMRTGLRGVTPSVVETGWPIDKWPRGAADVGVVMFDPPRLYYDRERTLWTPQPEELPQLARWLRSCGVTTLAVVLPHAQGRLPEALKRGLASLDEQAVAAMEFERLLIIRTPRKPRLQQVTLLHRVARLMLSVLKYMVPASEQPVRASRVAELLAVALRTAPAGIHIAAPELVWRAAQGSVPEVARQWLGA
jgi:hypothetical protein